MSDRSDTSAVPIATRPARGGLAGWQVNKLRRLAAGELQGLNVAKLAGHLALSPDHFSRAFQVSIGKPPGRWLREVRIARAKSLLDGSALPIGSIAREVGYEGAPQLQRPFVALTGFNPSQWRRRHDRRLSDADDDCG